jgi:hypothetical protein
MPSFLFFGLLLVQGIPADKIIEKGCGNDAKKPSLVCLQVRESVRIGDQCGQ